MEYGIGRGWYVSNMQDLKRKLRKQMLQPVNAWSWKSTQTVEQFDDLEELEGDKEQSVYESGEEYEFPLEYAVSGWFRWTGAITKRYSMMFRLTLNEMH